MASDLRITRQPRVGREDQLAGRDRGPWHSYSNTPWGDLVVEHRCLLPDCHPGRECGRAKTSPQCGGLDRGDTRFKDAPKVPLTTAHLADLLLCEDAKWRGARRGQGVNRVVPTSHLARVRGRPEPTGGHEISIDTVGLAESPRLDDGLLRGRRYSQRVIGAH